MGCLDRVMLSWQQLCTITANFNLFMLVIKGKLLFLEILVSFDLDHHSKSPYTVLGACYIYVTFGLSSY